MILKKKFWEERLLPSIELRYIPQPPGGGTSPGSGLRRSQTEGGGAIIANAGTGATAGAQTGSAAAGGAAGIGNLLPWLYPTADFLNFDKGPRPPIASGNGVIPMPAIGNTDIVLQFTVPQGRNGKITQLGIDVIQAVNTDPAFIPNTGMLQFSIYTDAKGYKFQDYENFFFLPGAVAAPTPINGLMIKENQTIYVSVKNLSLQPGTNYCAARLLGYYYSKSLEPKIQGYQ
jgi:hypothetical protein